MTNYLQQCQNDERKYQQWNCLSMWTAQVLKHVLFAPGREETGLIEIQVEGVTSVEPQETSQ